MTVLHICSISVETALRWSQSFEELLSCSGKIEPQSVSLLIVANGRPKQFSVLPYTMSMSLSHCNALPGMRNSELCFCLPWGVIGPKKEA